MEQFSIHFWQLALPAIVALVYAAALYFRVSKDELNSVWRWILASIRFFCILLLCLLLSSPVFQTRVETQEKPILFIALDQSASMQPALEYSDPGKTLPQNLAALTEQISDRFEIICFGFGKSIQKEINSEFSQSATNYQAAFDYIQSIASSRNAAVLLISDGNVNSGTEATRAYRKCAYPIFTLAVGDTTNYPDLAIENCRANTYVYKGQTFPLEIELSQHPSEAENTSLSLYLDGKIVKKENIELTLPHQTIQWEIEAPAQNTARYTLHLAPTRNEKDTLNNIYSFYVHVLDRNKKIVILTASPHPDIKAIRQSLNSNPLYQVEVVLAQDIKQLEEADLYILHGLPSQKYPLETFRTQLEKNPLWFIFHSTTDFSLFNQWNTGMEVTLKNVSWNTSLPILSSQFSLFGISPDIAQAAKLWPPLASPFADFKTTLTGQSILSQKIMQVNTDIPLLWFSQNLDVPARAILCGSGIWQWPLQEYRQTKNLSGFYSLLDQSIQLLTQSRQQNRLIIKHPQISDEQNRILMEAILYDLTYEKVGSAEIKIEIQEKGSQKKYQYRFLPEKDHYILDLGFMPHGEYEYLARTEWDGNEIIAEGGFLIRQTQLENRTHRTHTEILQQLSHIYGGKFYYAGKDPSSPERENKEKFVGNILPDSLSEDLLERKDLRPVIGYKEVYRNLLDKPIILILILTLFSLEFLLRKYKGNFSRI